MKYKNTEKKTSQTLRHWTSADERYLRQHRTDGAALLSCALGRSRRAVEVMASRLGISLRPSTGGVCSVCGCYEVRPHTDAGRAGMCPVCWERRKAKAMEERNAMREAMRAYEAAKKRG